MNKAIFLDRDGTINVEKHYLYKIEDFEYINGVIDALRLLQAKGYLLIIITNQSGIARGYYTEEEFQLLNNWMISDLEAKGINIAKVYYCPHHPLGMIETYTKKCNCRKPDIGLFKQAQEEFQIDMGKSYAVGDKLRDIAICQTTEVKGILLNNTGIEVKGKTDFICTDLMQAAELISRLNTEGR